MANNHSIIQSHRNKQLEANKRNYPEMYETICSEKFLTWYKNAAGKDWDTSIEYDVNEVMS